MPPFTVSPAAPHELLPACRLLFADGVAEARRDRLLSDTPASGVFVARSEGKLHAAALVQVLPGATGIAWAPRGDSLPATAAATAAACEWLRARGVKVCQAFAPASEVATMAPLERNGFRRTTQLVFMQRDLPLSCLVLPRLPRPFSLRPQSRPFSEQFAATLLETHDGTRDCPELNARRTPAEILDGFSSSTKNEWHLAEHEGNRIGVIVTEVDSVSAVAELTYIGVVPSYRGRGYGTDLLNYAMAGVAAEGARVLTLSVDARNTPAVRLYERHGFVEYDRREVWLASWSR